MAAKDIFERLKQDHDKHRAMIAAIEACDARGDERKALFEEYKTDASAHAATEELTLYAELMAMVDERIYAQHSAADHHEIGEKFEELDKLDVRSDDWFKKFAELKKTYLDHLREEEETIFGKAREALGEQKSVELRDAFNAKKPEEVERAEAGIDEKLQEQL